MNRWICCLLVAFMTAAAAARAQAPAPGAPVLAAPAGRSDRPLTAFPHTPGLDVGAMDTKAQACEDFYQYACGGWIAQNPIPGDQASWSVYGKLTDDNEHFLWGILDGLAANAPGRSAPQKLIGDYFAACMDEAAVERRGAQPLRRYLDPIEAMTSKADLPAVLSELHLSLADGGLFFQFTSNQDFADSSQVIAFAAAGGLGLPDRDYYTKTDAKSVTLRRRYARHVARMLGLLGVDPAEATREAASVLRMETALAGASLTRVELRDPHKLFHKVNARGLDALTPDFAWSPYLRHAGMESLDSFNVTEPRFFRALDHLWRGSSLADIKTYLRWHVAHATAPYLTAAFVQENFEFYSKTLRGIPEPKPRWKRCVRLVDEQLGEALGLEFVRRTFGPELKERTLLMTRQIEEALRTDLDQLTWMSPATKANALEKLRGITNKIGYPDRWRDYGPVHIERNDFLGNVESATQFESRRQLAKIGKPLDRREWQMTPPTVNAYYDPQMNDINFPAGVLQPPLYDPAMDDAPNYGDTGGTIGHELTHGFDDEGRQFDAHGNLRDWWTKEDSQQFDARAQCVVDQYAGYTIVDDIKLNSKLTEGEDIADLGGLVLAWMAWQAQIAQAPPPARLRDGFTPPQRFFIGYAQWACESTRPDELRVRALTNPHSPGRYRVNGLVVNMPEFATAFSCKVGQPMVKEKPCRIW
jgi:endothelin-converting enzyme/putative endopeptidase